MDNVSDIMTAVEKKAPHSAAAAAAAARSATPALLPSSHL